MKKAIELIWIATAKSFIRWFGGLPLWGKASAAVGLLVAAIGIGLPIVIGYGVLWIGYKLTLGRLIR